MVVVVGIPVIDIDTFSSSWKYFVTARRGLYEAVGVGRIDDFRKYWYLETIGM